MKNRKSVLHFASFFSHEWFPAEPERGGSGARNRACGMGCAVRSGHALPDTITNSPRAACPDRDPHPCRSA